MYRGITFRSFFYFIFLATFILLAISLFSLQAHQNAMRTLVAERDQRSVELLSTLLSEQLNASGDPVHAIATTLDNLLENNLSNAVFVVDSDGNLIYQQGHLHDDDAFLVRHAGVADGLGGKSGVLFAPAPDGEHIVAYTPIDNSDWVVVVEEPWQQVFSLRLRATQIAPITLIPLMVLMLGALWVGQRQVITPLQRLAQQAAQLGDSDFNAIQSPVNGIAEIRGLQLQFQEMAQKVQYAQRKLRDYAGSVTSEQEEERKRIARELHDGAIQTLTVINQEVQLAQWDNPQGELGKMLTHVEEEITVLTKDLRDMIRDLRPSYLDELGLVAAVDTLVKSKRVSWGIPIRFHVEGEERLLDSAESIALYRIAQEALLNVRQHARASDVSVYIHYNDTHIRLCVLDNGTGFTLPPSFISNSADGHFGLLGAQERAELIGATLLVESAPNKGTEVSVILPHRVASMEK